MPFFRFILTLLGTFLPVTVFYFLDKRFNVKLKLVKQFKTITSYKITMVIVTLILYALYMTVIYSLGSSLFFEGFAIIFLYQYLIYKPELRLNPDD